MPTRPLTRSLAGLAVCLAAASAPAQDTADPRADIRSTYDFEPSAMSFADQARRAPALSQLWDRFDKNPQSYREALRIELRAEGARELLYCDGGMLLLAKSREADDQALGLASIRKCSLAQIQHTPYFYTLHRLATLGVDTFELQRRMLTRADYSAFIVQHALTLGQDYAFLYPFLVQEESAYVPRLLSLLAGETDATAQRSVVRALWYAATPEAVAAVTAAATDARLSESARKEAKGLMEGLGTIRGWGESDRTLRRLRDAVKVSAATTESELRTKRRARMRAISDEALYDLDAYTALIHRSRLARRP